EVQGGVPGPRRRALSIGGLGVHVGAPITCDDLRGGPRLRRGGPSIGGFGGHVGAPITCDDHRGAPRLRRGAPSIGGFGGHVGAPMKMDEFEEGCDKGVTDVLPVVPPTRARVEAMLAATHRARDELLGEMPPNYGRGT